MMNKVLLSMHMSPCPSFHRSVSLSIRKMDSTSRKNDPERSTAFDSEEYSTDFLPSEFIYFVRFDLIYYFCYFYIFIYYI